MGPSLSVGQAPYGRSWPQPHMHTQLEHFIIWHPSLALPFMQIVLALAEAVAVMFAVAVWWSYAGCETRDAEGGGGGAWKGWGAWMAGQRESVPPLQHAGEHIKY